MACVRSRAQHLAHCSNIGAINRSPANKVKLRFRSMSKTQNIVGAQVRKLRVERDLTQDALAARCNVLGWDLSRATMSKIEAQLRCVTDSELVVLADALDVPLNSLYPSKHKARR
jgi:hypothetical protein